MIRLLILGWVYLFAGVVGYSQPVDCSNIGFEEGTFRGWERWAGEVSPYVFPVSFQIEPGSYHPVVDEYGHVITSISDGFDPNVKERLPVVAPGSQHSIRIGDLEAGGYVDQIRTTFDVTAEKPLLRYQFAVVLENPNHSYYHQPGFSLLIQTTNGDTISCGYYEAVATNATAGFRYQERDEVHNLRRLIYRNWTTNVLDLRGYVGQQLRMVVTSHDCLEGGHFGYAYFDAQCVGMTIEAATVCVQQGTLMRLTAPAGFDRYQWSTGDTTATIYVQPTQKDTYWVDVESRAVLKPDCRTQLRMTYEVDKLLVPTSQQVTICAGEPYQVGDSIYYSPGTYQTVIRRDALCDSTVITHLAWLPFVGSVQSVTLCKGAHLVVGDSTYTTTGTYQTRFRRAAPLCDSVVTTHLVIQQVDLGSFQDTLVVQGDSIQLKALVPGGANYTYSWSPTDGLSCPTCAVTWAKPGQTTQYRLTARIADSGCEASQTMRVQVVPCTINVPNSFSPNSDGINDQFTILSSPCIKQVRLLTVYNRWGQVIFYGTNESNQNSSVSWDGTFRGEAADVGVYPYQILFESPVGGVRKHSGALLLLR